MSEIWGVALALFVGGVMGWIASQMADRKGRSPWGGFILGFLLPLLGIAIVALLPARPDAGVPRVRTADTRTVALAATMTAVVLVLTGAVRVPTPARGYIHLGDAAIFFSALAFGPIVGAVAGGLGTFLADALFGYPQWAVFSLIIHGAQGWVVGWTSRRWPGTAGLIVAAVAGGVIVVVGYLGAGILLSGLGAAVAEVPLNILQVTVGALVGIPLFAAVRRAYPPLVR